ncbi:TPA: hypothetical protein HA273_05295 [Candidatus Bathyarchaeota archaeon]|nr:hypothetical protein [Candidatus Bathyarchaeota archaeon]HIJ08172.1 hypothetical protein [Candidatus Bathyarchaeota archaeon]
MRNKNEENGGIGKFDLNSKFWRSFLTIVAVALIFAGPTYLTYALNALNMSYLISVAVGIVMFAVGIVLLVYLIKKKVIT